MVSCKLQTHKALMSTHSSCYTPLIQLYAVTLVHNTVVAVNHCARDPFAFVYLSDVIKVKSRFALTILRLSLRPCNELHE